MKQTIKSILAFVALMLCGGAWAAAPVAIWTNFTGADADAGITKGNYTLKANGNSVATDGSSIEIDQNVGVKIDRSAALANTAGMTVVYKFRNLVVGGTDKTLATSSTNTSGNDQSGVKITTTGQTSGMWGTGDYNTSATQTTIGSVNSGSLAFVYGPKVTGNTGTYLYLKNGAGAYTSIYSCGGLKGQDDTPAGMAIGGRRAANNSFPAATGLVIESVAVFDNALTAAELATFSFEKEMLYYFPLDGNKDNVGGIGNLTLTKGGSTDEANFWNDGGALSSDKCYKGNGANQGYILGDGSSTITSFAQGWTLSWWVKPNDLANWRDVCGFHIGATGYKLEKNGSNQLQVYNSSTLDALATPIPYTDNSASKWVHIAFVSNVDGETISVYGNGVYLCNLGPKNGTMLWGNSTLQGLTKVSIGLNGVYNVNNGTYLNGMVDEVSIYNFSMTPSQVAMLSTQKPSAEACLDGRDLASAIVKNGEINNANPHLLMHLDASNEESFELDGANVSKWKDLSSNARHATPADARVNSAWSTTKATRETVDGHAVVNMGATGSGIDLSFTRMTNIRTVIFAMSIEQNANAFFLGDNGNNVYPFHRGGSGQYAMNNAVFGNNRDSNVWCDGVAKRPTLDTPPTDCHIYTIELGADGTANRLSQDRDINGRNGGRAISEMLVFDRVLTPSERAAVESYLSKKWNISPVVPPQLSRKVIAANFGADYTTIPATVDTQFPLVSLPGSAWTQTRTGSNTSGISIDVIDPMTLAATGESATLKWASSGTYRENGGSEKSSALTNGYIDDAAHDGTSGATINFEQIPFDSYDVVIVGATDGGSRTFRAVSVAAGDAAAQSYTFADGVTKVGDSNWGESYYRVPEEGKNALVIKGLTGATLTIQGGSNANTSRGGIAAVMIIDAGEKVWTNGTGDGNWNTAGNWAMGRVPTAEDDVIINTPATISFTTASTVKSIAINDDVTFMGSIADGTIKNITIADGKTLTVDVAQGVEDKIRGIKGGTVVKKGAGALSFNNGNSDKALDGTLVKIDQGKVLANCDNGDAVLQDPTFIIGENGELDNYGWFTVNGTLTVESNFDKSIFTNVGGNNTGIKGFTSFVKKGTGNVKLMAWKANERSEKCAIDAAIEIQAGRLTFRPQGSGYTVNGTISGAGSVGVIAGSDTSHYVILGGNNVNNSYTGGTVVESGTLGLGFKNALGGQGKTLLVEAGATVDVRGIVDHGSVCTLNGGTIKNSTSDCGRGSVQFRSIELTADSIVDLAYATGIINNNYNETSIKLNGFKLTKKGSAALYLVSVTTANAGTLRLEAGSIHFMGGDQTYPANKAPATSQMTLEVAGANVGLPGNYALTFANVTIENNCSLNAGSAALTVNGTLKVDGSIAKTTTIASTGTLDLSMAEENSIASHITGNLTIAIGAKLIFPTDYVENTPITLTAGTLAATSGSGQVSTDGGETFVPATVTYDVEAKTVKYVTALNEYALTDADIAAIEAKNITLGGAGIIQVATETDIAKSCTFTNVPEGYTVYGLGGKFIGVVKMNYEAEKEEVLNTAALHFDASRLNTIAAGQDNAVTVWDNLGADTTRPNATVNGNGRAANNSPTFAASSNSIAIDFGECNSQMDLGWSRIGGIKAVIQVIDIKADKRAFLFGDYNNGSGAYGFHRGQQNSNPYYFNGNSRIAKVYDNGVDKGNGQSQSCPAGMRVISLTATRNDVYSDCFTTDRDNCDNRSGGRKLCEVLVFTEVLTDAKRVEIEDYLLRKWFNAKAVVNGVPKATIQEALDAAEGNYANVHTLVEPTAQEIPDGWVWKNGSFYPIIAKVGQRSYASIEEAVASLQEGETIVEVVVKATSFVKAPADAAYTIKYTAGAGSDSEDGSAGVALDHSAGKITLAGSTPYYLKGEWATYGNPTITFDSATVYYKGTGDNGTFGVSTATYVIQGNSRVEANRFILSQGGASRTANVTIKDSAVVTITGNNDNHSNQATVMIGHWNGPSTLTIQDSAKLVVPNAGIHIGQTGNTQTINLNGGTLEAKGITMADNSATSQLNLAGGTLKLGEMGIDKYADKVLTITMTDDTAIEATAATFPLEQTIVVPTDKTLTFTSSTLTMLDISNITLATGAALDLSGCTALVSVPVGMKEDVASVPYSQITMPDGAAYAVTPTHAEYANGSLTVTDVPEGVNLKVQLPGDEGLGEMTRDGTTLTYKGDVKISGYATSFDATFTTFSDYNSQNPSAEQVAGTLNYKEISEPALQYDNNPQFINYDEDAEGNKVAKKDTGIKLIGRPYIKSIPDSWWTGTRELTLAVVGVMPNSQKTTFIHMGHTQGATTRGLLIATGTKDDEVVVLWNEGSTVHEITSMSVPNAASSRHVYIVTKQDDPDANTTTFTVYLDGMKWKTIAVTPLFTIKGGVQVGSDFGGAIKDLPDDNAGKYYQVSGNTTGSVNLMRVYGRVISDAEIAKYSAEDEYPYHSPNGSSARTFAEGSANWIETTSVWANTPAEGEASTDTTPLAGASVTATLDGAVTIAVNVPVEGAAYEALDIAGTGSATFTSATDSGAIRVTGMVTIGRPITVKPGSLDLGTAPITLLEDGTLTFDYSAFDANACEKETKINLTGDIAQDTKVTCEKPSVDDFHTVNFAYDSSIKQYVLTIGLVAVNPEDPPVIEPENIPETWKDVPEVEGQGGRYFVENEDGKLEIKEGTPANGLTSYESYVLQLDPEDEASKPVVSAEQDSSATSITIVDNITVRDGKTATRKLKIGTTAESCVEVSADYNNGFTVELPSGDDKVKFIKIEYVIQ